MQTNDTDVAIMLNRPTLPLKEENLKAIESFVVSLYVTKSDMSSNIVEILKFDCYTGCFDPTYL